MPWGRSLSKSAQIVPVAIILLALGKGLLWAILIPPWYGPDEASHYAYVQGIVEDNSLPTRSDPNAGLYYPTEIACSESKVGIGFAGEFHAEPSFSGTRRNCSASTAWRHALAPTNAAATYFPLYYAGAVPFYVLAQADAVEVRLAAVRLWSVLLGVVAAIFCWLAVRLALPEAKGIAIAATVLFIFQPMNSQQTAVVNNDALLLALAALFWWRFYAAYRSGISGPTLSLLAALAGAAYLAKPQGIFLAAALPVLIVVTLRGLPPRRRPAQLARLAVAGAAPLAAAILISVLYASLARKAGIAPLSVAGFHGVSQYLAQYAAHNFERAYVVWVTSFWGYFGWYQVNLPGGVYLVALLATLVGIVGALRLLLERSTLGAITAVTALCVVLPAALIQLLELYTFRSTGALVLQGRSFLMLLIPLIVLLLSGWGRLLPRAATWGLAPAAVLLALLLNLISVARIVDTLYG